MTDKYIHIIAFIAVVSRMADVLSTYLVTPTLKLEANSVAKRFGWIYGLLTIFIGFIPYWNPPLGPRLGIIVFTASFMVAASNSSKILMARALGEEEFVKLMHRVYLNTKPWPGLLFLLMPAFFSAALGASFLRFYPWEPAWGYYFGLGMFAYAFAMVVWYPVRFFKIRKDAANKIGS